MTNKFKDIEREFSQLKQKFKEKRISSQEYKDQLKILRLRDRKGKFWTIGAQTRKWYYFDGKKWIQAQPPSIQEGKVICIHCGFENDLKAEFCASCSGNLGMEESKCPECGYELEDISQECPKCSKESRMWEEMAEEIEIPSEEEIGQNVLLRSVNPASFFLFFGAVGFFIGIIIGAIAGTSDYFLEIIKNFPVNLQEIHGKLLGGLVFGLVGGVLSFMLFGAIGFLKALFLNMIFYFIGGIKIHLKRTD